MTLKRRLERLERKQQLDCLDATEIPTPVLEAMLLRAWLGGDHTPEEEELYRQWIKFL